MILRAVVIAVVFMIRCIVLFVVLSKGVRSSCSSEAKRRDSAIIDDPDIEWVISLRTIPLPPKLCAVLLLECMKSRTSLSLSDGSVNAPVHIVVMFARDPLMSWRCRNAIVP